MTLPLAGTCTSKGVLRSPSATARRPGRGGMLARLCCVAAALLLVNVNVNRRTFYAASAHGRRPGPTVGDGRRALANPQERVKLPTRSSRTRRLGEKPTIRRCSGNGVLGEDLETQAWRTGSRECSRGGEMSPFWVSGNLAAVICTQIKTDTLQTSLYRR